MRNMNIPVSVNITSGLFTYRFVRNVLCRLFTIYINMCLYWETNITVWNARRYAIRIAIQLFIDANFLFQLFRPRGLQWRERSFRLMLGVQCSIDEAVLLSCFLEYIWETKPY